MTEDFGPRVPSLNRLDLKRFGGDSLVTMSFLGIEPLTSQTLSRSRMEKPSVGIVSLCGAMLVTIRVRDGSSWR